MRLFKHYRFIGPNGFSVIEQFVKFVPVNDVTGDGFAKT